MVGYLVGIVARAVNKSPLANVQLPPVAQSAERTMLAKRSRTSVPATEIAKFFLNTVTPFLRKLRTKQLYTII